MILWIWIRIGVGNRDRNWLNEWELDSNWK